MPHVMTVTGPITPEALGRTLMHEHVLCDITPRVERTEPPTELTITLAHRFALDRSPAGVPGVYRLKSLDEAAHDLTAFRAAGGSAIVDLTTGGIEPDPEGLVRLSAATGVAIVLGAGFYYDAYVPEHVKTWPVEQLRDTILEQLTVGAWGSTVRCGLIGEIGTSWPITAFERRSLEAAAQAQAATGALINIHPGRHPEAADAVLDILEGHGADPNRVVMSHMDRSYPADPAAVVALARRCIVEYDFFGVESSAWIRGVDMPNDIGRLRAVRALFEAGLGHRVTISHDICTRPRLLLNGGHGYRHILVNLPPLMRDRGWTQDEIDTLLIETPRRLLTLPG